MAVEEESPACQWRRRIHAEVTGVDRVEKQLVHEPYLTSDQLCIGIPRLQRDVLLSEREDARRFDADDQRAVPRHRGQVPRHRLRGARRVIEAALGDRGSPAALIPDQLDLPPGQLEKFYGCNPDTGFREMS